MDVPERGTDGAGCPHRHGRFGAAPHSQGPLSPAQPGALEGGAQSLGVGRRTVSLGAGLR